MGLSNSLALHRLGGFAVVVGIFLMFGTGCGGDSSLEEIDCETDQDCPRGAMCDGGYCVVEPCADDQADCDDRCVDLDSDPNHCGECGISCGDEEICIAGSCEVPMECPGEQTQCGDACVNTDTHRDHCGACEESCDTDIAGAVADCEDGSCVFACADDGQTLCEEDRVCADLQTDDDHCGECGDACGDGQICSGGECVCPQGTTDCDGECVNVDADPDHCGGCNESCGDSGVCWQGMCVDDCPPGQLECDGACVDASEDPDHCGGCDNECDTDIDGAVAECRFGTCVDECTGDEETLCVDGGVCADLQTDDENCGICARTCTTDVDGAEASCEQGECVETCTDPDQTYCDGFDACVDLDGDPDHCGGCGDICTTDVDGAVAACQNGSCQPICADSDDTLCEDEGVCSSLDTDDHCGECGDSCGDGETCDGGSCVCADGYTDCDGECIDTDADADHCGGCNEPCGADDVCSGGECVGACPDGQTACGGSCWDLDVSDEHCGECDNECTTDIDGAFAFCDGGTCVEPCAGDDEEVCDDSCVDTRTDDDHCGECGTECTTDIDGAVAYCDGSACVEQCVSDSADEVCDDTCVDTWTDDEHCGECGTECTTDIDGAVAYCDEGDCVEQCAGDSDDDVCDDTCVDTQTDDDHCGECSNACETDVEGAVAFCDGGNCVEQCVFSTHSICEDENLCVDLDADDEHCGTCGNVCETEITGAITYCDGDGNCAEECFDADETLCEDYDVCADLQSDDDHCSECGSSCEDGETCQSGECVEDDPCGSGQTYCPEDDVCADLQTDDDHCGTCGNNCETDETCENGNCVSEPTGECDPDGEPFGGGNGDVVEPYRICTASHLIAIDDEEYLGDHFEMHDHIELGGIQPFEIIAHADGSSGDWDGAFTGVFDGNGYQIRDLMLDEPNEDHVGLFGVVDSGTVRNAELTGVDVTGREEVGGLVGHNDGTIEDSSSDGTVVGDEVVGGLVGYNAWEGIVDGGESGGTVTASTDVGRDVGGLVGESYGEIANSSSSAEVLGTTRVGGLVGRKQGSSNCSIDDSHATGAVDVQPSDNDSIDMERIGGLVGSFPFTYSECDVIDSTASGDALAPGVNYVGGLIGWIGSGLEVHIEGAAAYGDVEGHFHTGGLVGQSNSSDNQFTLVEAHGDVTGSTNTGGLFGRLWGDVDVAQATGNVTGQDRAGGLVGFIEDGGSVTEGEFHSEVTGNEEVGGIAGRTEGAISDSHSDGHVIGSHYTGGITGSLMEDAYLADSTSGGIVEGDNSVGGAVGYAESGSDFGDNVNIFRTGSSAEVHGDSFVGGVAGQIIDVSNFSRAYATGEVHSSGGEHIGGLVGRTRAIISHSYSAATVIAPDSDSVGGVTGTLRSTGIITDTGVQYSYAIGDVEGNDRVGGLIGYFRSGEVFETYAAGFVDGSGSPVGGLIGELTDGYDDYLERSYWNEDTTGMSQSDGGELLTDDEFDDEDSFENWNFDSDTGTWVMGVDRPLLQWEEEWGGVDHRGLMNLRTPGSLGEASVTRSYGCRARRRAAQVVGVVQSPRYTRTQCPWGDRVLRVSLNLSPFATRGLRVPSYLPAITTCVPRPFCVTPTI